MNVRKFIDVLESSISKSDHGRNWNVLFAYICLCAMKYITYKSSQFFAFVFFFLDVHVRFSSQCELTNNWSNNNKQWSDFLYNLINLKIWVVLILFTIFFRGVSFKIHIFLKSFLFFFLLDYIMVWLVIMVRLLIGRLI